jgi:hypothetical protein
VETSALDWPSARIEIANANQITLLALSSTASNTRLYRRRIEVRLAGDAWAISCVSSQSRRACKFPGFVLFSERIDAEAKTYEPEI